MRLHSKSSNLSWHINQLAQVTQQLYSYGGSVWATNPHMCLLTALPHEGTGLEADLVLHIAVCRGTGETEGRPAALTGPWVSWHWEKGHVLTEWRSHGPASLPITYKLEQQLDLMTEKPIQCICHKNPNNATAQIWLSKGDRSVGALIYKDKRGQEDHSWPAKTTGTFSNQRFCFVRKW